MSQRTNSKSRRKPAVSCLQIDSHPSESSRANQTWPSKCRRTSESSSTQNIHPFWCRIQNTRRASHCSTSTTSPWPILEECTSKRFSRSRPSTWSRSMKDRAMLSVSTKSWARMESHSRPSCRGATDNILGLDDGLFLWQPRTDDLLHECGAKSK